MNQKDLAIDYLNESKIRLKTAESVINEKAYAYCVRQCQEAVELSLKASLRLIGIDFPKWHDIGEILTNEKEKFPKLFQNTIDKLATISQFLNEKRERAMYGDETHQMPPSKIFDKQSAIDALGDANFCIRIVEQLFEQLIKKKSRKDSQESEENR